MTAEQQPRASQPAANWQPGLIAIHGNQTEALADTVLAWLAAHPLQALEPEIVLVQSNGMAEWFKMRMAEQQGVRRSTGRVAGALCLAQLPADSGQARGTARIAAGQDAHDLAPDASAAAVSGRASVCAHCQLSAPRRAAAPAAAGQLADLFDQYQIYRADWLAAWEQGEDVLRTAGRPTRPCLKGSSGSPSYGARCWPSLMSRSVPPPARPCWHGFWARCKAVSRRSRRWRAAWWCSA